MTMTWRERIAAARERGAFTDQDRSDWAEPHLCFVGEQRAKYDLWFSLEMDGIDTHNHECGPLQLAIQRAINTNDFDAAERLLDEVEDKALVLKREYREAGHGA